MGEVITVMKFTKAAWSWISTFGIAFILVLLIGIFVFQPYKVNGHSMDPTLQDKQRVYVLKLSHTFSYLPDYGDIVIIDSRVGQDRTWKDDFMEHPFIALVSGYKNEQGLYVKRVIGRPDDVLEFKNNKVYRNGEPIEESYIKETMNYESDQEWIVPKDHIFVMGDNRNNSQDSRAIGFIPLDHVLGKKIP
jgi:signal peptidase I